MAIVFLLTIISNYINAQTQFSKTHQVVMQLNVADTAIWNGLMSNIKNLQKVWPEKLNIEVVVHGKALGFIMKNKTHLETEIKQLLNNNLHIKACENSMKKHGVIKAELIDGIETVPSGVAEIILKQEDGWSYLKAG